MRLGVAASLVFLLLAGLVVLGLTKRVDLATTVALQRFASHWLDALANAHTVLGQLSVTLVIAVLLTAYLWWRRLPAYSWLAPLLILVIGMVELAFKFGLSHPGPPVEFVRAFGNPLGVRVESPSSFPSGHVARLTFLGVLSAELFRSNLLGVGAAALAVASVLARVYIGDHWVSDALGGLALGAAVGALAALWLRLAPLIR